MEPIDKDHQIKMLCDRIDYLENKLKDPKHVVSSMSGILLVAWWFGNMIGFIAGGFTEILFRSIVCHVACTFFVYRMFFYESKRRPSGTTGGELPGTYPSSNGHQKI